MYSILSKLQIIIWISKLTSLKIKTRCTRGVRVVFSVQECDLVTVLV